MPLWPVIHLQFAEPPDAEYWQIFTSLIFAGGECIGIKEIGPDPQKAPEPHEIRAAELFFASIEEEPAAAQLTKSLMRESFEALAKIWLPTLDGAPSITLQPPSDWTTAWRQYFKMTRISERLYCCPPWDTELPADAPPDAELLIIEPGQAFGTGTHATTQLCLRLIERVLLPGTRVLDWGTGSGILLIGALKLGAAEGTGFDIDDICIDNFYFNAELNGMKGRMEFVVSGTAEHALQYAEAGEDRPQLQLCNMLSREFLPLLPVLGRLRMPLILSGFLTEEEAAVREACAAAGFAVAHQLSEGEWGAFYCTPKEPS